MNESSILWAGSRHFIFLARYRQNHKCEARQMRSGWILEVEKHRELQVLVNLSALRQLNDQEKHRKLLILVDLSALFQLSEIEKHRKLQVLLNLSAFHSADRAKKAS